MWPRPDRGEAPPPTDHSDWFRDEQVTEPGQKEWHQSNLRVHMKLKLEARWLPLNVLDPSKGQRSHPLAPAHSCDKSLDG